MDLQKNETVSFLYYILFKITCYTEIWLNKYFSLQHQISLKVETLTLINTFNCMCTKKNQIFDQLVIVPWGFTSRFFSYENRYVPNRKQTFYRRKFFNLFWFFIFLVNIDSYSKTFNAEFSQEWNLKIITNILKICNIIRTHLNEQFSPLLVLIRLQISSLSFLLFVNGFLNKIFTRAIWARVFFSIICSLERVIIRIIYEICKRHV